MFIIEDNIHTENIERVLRGYYTLLVKMNRMSRLSLSEPEFSLISKRWVDKVDSNLQDTIAIVKEINADDTLRVLNLYDENGGLLAMARFREKTADSELLVGDIIITGNVENTSEVYESMIIELLHHAKESDLDMMYVEVPLADGTLKVAAEKLGFAYGDEFNQDKDRFRTILLRRNVLEEFRGDDYGRYRTNKQTVPYHE